MINFLIFVVYLIVSCNSETQYCSDDSGACEFDDDVTFGGNNAPASSIQSKLGISQLEPKKIPCGWKDGGAKKVDIHLNEPQSISQMLSSQVIQVFLASGVECDEYAKPQPSGKNIIMTLQAGETSIMKQGIKISEIQTDPEISCVCVVLWCEKPRGVGGDCIVHTKVKYYDDFGLPGTFEKTMGMAWWDFITLFIGVLEISIIAFGVYYIRTFVIPKVQNEKPDKKEKKNVPKKA